jgi:hypothetical protein
MGTLRGDPVPCFHGLAPYYPIGTVNAKVVTADLARQMRFWARMGFPDGSTFTAKPFLEQHKEYAWQSPLLRDITPHPWALFDIAAWG